jgi:hypothetical protein
MFAFPTKSGLAFVHMGDSLCFPFNANFPPIVVMSLVSSVVTAFEARVELLQLGTDPYTPGMVMPVQRLFNRGRIASRFDVPMPARDRANPTVSTGVSCTH